MNRGDFRPLAPFLCEIGQVKIPDYARVSSRVFARPRSLSIRLFGAAGGGRGGGGKA